MPFVRKVGTFLDEVLEFLLSVVHHWRGALTSSVVISVGLTVYQLTTNEALKLKPYLWTLVGVGLPVAVFLAWAEEYRGRGAAQQELDRLKLAPAHGAVDLSPILDAQLRLSNSDASHESQLKQLREEKDAIQAELERYKSDAEQHKSTIQVVLRNQVVVLAAELGEIWKRVNVKVEADYIHYEPPLWRMSMFQRQAAGLRALKAHYAPRWEQYLQIWRAEFAERVKETINELRLAGVASDKLMAFPEADPLYPGLPLDDFIPRGVPETLIPELLNAANALTRSQSS